VREIEHGVAVDPDRAAEGVGTAAAVATLDGSAAGDGADLFGAHDLELGGVAGEQPEQGEDGRAAHGYGCAFARERDAQCSPGGVRHGRGVPVSVPESDSLSDEGGRSYLRHGCGAVSVPDSVP